MLSVCLIIRFKLIVCEVLDSKYLMALEKHNAQDDAVVNAVEDDPSPHLRSDDMLMPRVWHSGQEFIKWGVSGQGQSCQSVHNQVDPKHLNWSQWGSFED